MGLGKTNRNKGHNYERDLVKLFKNLGYTHARTSRQASRLYDDSGIDLWGIDFLVQAKNGYEKTRIKPDVEFRKMSERVKENFPPNSPEHHLPKILFNKLDGYKKENHIVSMQYDEFCILLAKNSFLNNYINSLEEIEKNKILENLKLYLNNLN